MPEMHWRQFEFTYSTCGPKRKEIIKKINKQEIRAHLQKNKEKIKKFKQTGDTNYIY